MKKIKEITENEAQKIVKGGKFSISVPATIHEVYRKSSSRGEVVKTPRGYRIKKERR